MGNFLIKSKYIYFSEPEKYKHFPVVFDAIKELSISKNYYDTDLFNIEEILSIIEMGSFLEWKRLKPTFLRYISDVITFFTQSLEPYGKELPGNWYDWIFGKNPICKPYPIFVSWKDKFEWFQQVTHFKNAPMALQILYFVIFSNDFNIFFNRSYLFYMDLKLRQVPNLALWPYFA